MAARRHSADSKPHPNSIPKKGESLADIYPSVAKMWHPKLNGNLTPYDVKPKSNFYFWWVCAESNCEHEHLWEAPLTELSNPFKKQR